MDIYFPYIRVSTHGHVQIIGLASIVVPPTDPLEQYLLDHENDM